MYRKTLTILNMFLFHCSYFYSVLVLGSGFFSLALVLEVGDPTPIRFIWIKGRNRAEFREFPVDRKRDYWPLVFSPSIAPEIESPRRQIFI